MLECVVFGGLLLDKYLEVEALPKRGGDGYIKNEFECVGGCAVNMAVTFNNLGGKAHIVSYVGEDKTGEAILAYMREHGISERYVAQKEGATGYCMVFLEADGERTFLTKPGMELEFNGEIVADGLKGIKYAAVTGYFLLDSAAKRMIEILEDFHEGGGIILFDPSPLVGSIDKNILKRMIAISRVLTPNNSEAQVMAEEYEGNAAEEKLQGWIKELRAQNKTIIVKSGENGGTVYRQGESFSYGALQARVVDTTGAGDSFAAGVLYGMASGLTIERAVTIGVGSAAITVGISGPHGFWKADELIIGALKEGKTDGQK